MLSFQKRFWRLSTIVLSFQKRYWRLSTIVLSFQKRFGRLSTIVLSFQKRCWPLSTSLQPDAQAKGLAYTEVRRRGGSMKEVVR